MTTIKEQIRAEVERKRDEHEKAARACSGLNVVAMTHGGAQKVCDEILAFIDSLPDEQPSKSLEEAAYTYSFESRPSVYGQVDVINAFIAGAKWQKEQKQQLLEQESVNDEPSDVAAGMNAGFDMIIGKLKSM